MQAAIVPRMDANGMTISMDGAEDLRVEWAEIGTRELVTDIWEAKVTTAHVHSRWLNRVIISTLAWILMLGFDLLLDFCLKSE